VAESQIPIPWDEVIGLALICTVVLTIAAASGILLLIAVGWVTLQGAATGVSLTAMCLTFVLLLIYFRRRLRTRS
jgi:hypothetical protein